MAFNQKRDDLLKAVLRNVGALEIGETPEPEIIAHVNDKLNKLIDYLDEAHGIRLWKLEWRQRVFNSPDVVTGSDSESYFCIRDIKSPNTTTWLMTTAYSVGDLVKPTVENGFYYEVTIAGTSGGSEPTFPLRQEETIVDGSVTWKTIPDTKPSIGKNHTSFWALGGENPVAYAQNTNYESGAEFALKSDELEIQRAFIRHGGLDDPIDLIDSAQFSSIGDKIQSNEPSLLYLDQNRLKNFLYPLPDLTNYVLHYQAVVAMNSLNNAGDSFDLPDKWMRPLEYILTADIAPSMGLGVDDIIYFERKGEALLDRVLKTDKPKITHRRISSAF